MQLFLAREAIDPHLSAAKNLLSKEELEGLKWMDQFNVIIRRKASHTVKKPITSEELVFAENVKKHIEEASEKYFRNPENY